MKSGKLGSLLAAVAVIVAVAILALIATSGTAAVELQVISNIQLQALTTSHRWRNRIAKHAHRPSLVGFNAQSE